MRVGVPHSPGPWHGTVLKQSYAGGRVSNPRIWEAKDCHQYKATLGYRVTFLVAI